MEDNRTVRDSTQVVGQRTSVDEMPALAPLNMLAYPALYAQPELRRPLAEHFIPLVRYRALVVLITIAGVVAGALFNTQPIVTYTSTSLVSMGSYLPPSQSPISGILHRDSLNRDNINARIALLKSYMIATKVLTANPDLRKVFDPTFETTLDSNHNPGDVTSSLVDNQSAAEHSQDSPMTERFVDFPEEVLNKYLSTVTHSVQLGNLVRISGTWTTGDVALKIANAQTKAFIQIVQEQRVRTANIALEALKLREVAQAKLVKEGEQKLYEFAKANGIAANNRTKTDDLVGRKFYVLQERLALIAFQRIMADSDYQALVTNTRELNTYLGSAELTTRYLELTDLKQEYNQIKKMRANDPRLPYLSRKIRVLDGMIKSSGKQQVANSKMRYESLNYAEKKLKNDHEKLTLEVASEAGRRIEYSHLEAQVESAREGQKQILARIEDVILNSENSQKTVLVIDPPMRPTKPNIIKPSNMMVSMGVGGFILGVILAILLHYSRGVIYSVSELRRAMQVPIVGVVPSIELTNAGQNNSGKFSRIFNLMSPGNLSNIRSRNAKKHLNGATDSIRLDGSPIDKMSSDDTIVGVGSESENQDSANRNDTAKLRPSLIAGEDNLTISDKNPLSGIKYKKKNEDPQARSHSLIFTSAPMSKASEAFRSMRTTLMYSGNNEPPQTLIVTSSEKGDGKTTVASNLAVSFARASIRTLLIDADLRLPKVHKCFNFSRQTPGLVEYLSGQSDFSDVILDSGFQNLSLLLSGGLHPAPTEILGIRQMFELIELLTGEYEQIIIDTPPVAVVSDSLLLSRLADGIIFVVRSRKTKLRAVEYSISRLRQVQAKVIGAVLNDVNKLQSSYGDSEYYLASEGFDVEDA